MGSSHFNSNILWWYGLFSVCLYKINKIMKTAIVLLYSDVADNTREICKSIENKTFNDNATFKDYLYSEHKIERDFVEVYELSEFVELVNDESLDILTSVFITYINVE